MNAQIISIGDELLIGQTINTNAAWIGEKLSEVGVAVSKVVVIGDVEQAIRDAIDRALREADLTLVTGGLGPTHDDITKKTVVDYFGGTLKFHPDILERLREAFKRRGFDMPAANENQAWLPDNAEILENRMGSAQGMLFKKNGRMCVVMPGVPREMKYIMENSVLPMLQQQGGDRVIRHHTWRTCGIPESTLFELLGDISELEQHGKLAFLPKYSGVDIRLSVQAGSAKEAETHVRFVEQRIMEKAGKYVFGTGDTPLEQALGELLTQRRETLAVAESCTGGLIANRITNIPGSSNYFLSGVVAYSNDEKIHRLQVSPETLERYGAVSEQTAREMALGVRKTTGATYGLSTTGIAGPGGATPEKPVGLVYIGLSAPNHLMAKRFTFGKDRLINKERSAYAAMFILYRVLRESA